MNDEETNSAYADVHTMHLFSRLCGQIAAGGHEGIGQTRDEHVSRSRVHSVRLRLRPSARSLKKPKLSRYDRRSSQPHREFYQIELIFKSTPHGGAGEGGTCMIILFHLSELFLELLDGRGVFLPHVLWSLEGEHRRHSQTRTRKWPS